MQETPELVHKSAVTKPLYEGLEQKHTAAGTTDTVKPTGIIALQESPELVHKAAVTKPLHAGLEQKHTAAGTTDTTKTTSTIALQVNAGRHELQGTAKYSPQGNPEQVDEGCSHQASA